MPLFLVAAISSFDWGTVMTCADAGKNSVSVAVEESGCVLNPGGKKKEKWFV
jgi:hypothetical protein